jgi:hypothetical protein
MMSWKTLKDNHEDEQMDRKANILRKHKDTQIDGHFASDREVLRVGALGFVKTNQQITLNGQVYRCLNDDGDNIKSASQ